MFNFINFNSILHYFDNCLVIWSSVCMNYFVIESKLYYNYLYLNIIKKILVLTKILLYSLRFQGRRSLVVKCFPRIHQKVTGSNHSTLAIHEFSFGLFVRILPITFLLSAFMYSA